MSPQWKASRGFGCASGVILLSFGMNQAFGIAYGSSTAFANWVNAHSYFAEFSFRALQNCMWVLVAFLFAGVQPLMAFVRETGFAKRFTFSGWLFACGAIGFGLLNLYSVQQGWSKENPSAKDFYRVGQVVWLHYLVQSTLVSPFVEEAVMRGFLYRAFRGSFGLIPSSVLVLLVQTYFHWGLVSRDVIALVFLLVGGAILCVIRERTENTWNCVLFHAVFNATVLRQWALSITAIVILLLLCRRNARANTLS